MIARYWRTASSGGPLTAMAVASGLVIIFLIVYPLFNLLKGLFYVNGRLTFAAIPAALAQGELATVLLNTVIYVLLSGGLALAVGAVLAWISERTDANLGWATAILPLIPLFLPALASAIGWVVLLAPRTGLVNVLLRAVVSSDADTGPIDIFTLGGMIFTTAIHLVPYSYLAIASALRNLDASMEEAARMSGAGILKTLAKIALPLVTPAAFSSAILIVMSGITLFSIPAILGGTAKFPVLSALIYKLVNSFPPQTGEAIVLCAIALSVVQVLMAVQLALGGRRFQTIGSQGLRRSRVSLRALRIPAMGLVVGYVLIAALLPFLALGFVSFERFWTPNITPAVMTMNNWSTIFAPTSQFVTALKNSLGIGIGVALLTMCIAVLLAYYLARSPGIVSRLVDISAAFPATIPHIVLGVAFLLAFSQPPLVLYGTLTLLFLAYVAMAMPQAMQFAKFNFGQISPELAEAARVFGASEARTFFRILTPLILPGAIAGGIVVAVHTINETNASIILGTVESQVVGPTLYAAWSAGNVPPVAAFATLICIMNAVLALASIYIGRVLSVKRTA